MFWFSTILLIINKCRFTCFCIFSVKILSCHQLENAQPLSLQILLLSYSPHIIHPGRPIRCILTFSFSLPCLLICLSFCLLFCMAFVIISSLIFFEGLMYSLTYPLSIFLFQWLFTYIIKCSLFKSSFPLIIIFCSIFNASFDLFSFSMFKFSQVLKICELYMLSLPI